MARSSTPKKHLSHAVLMTDYDKAAVREGGGLLSVS